MASTNKKNQGLKKIEKETRKLIQANSSMIKPRGDGSGYKFRDKLKKKQRKQLQQQCVHFIERKGKIHPVVGHDPENPGNWKCHVCGASFPRKPLKEESITAVTNGILEVINQAQFFSVLMGGDSRDTKMFADVKAVIPRMRKSILNISVAVDKKAQYEDRKTQTNSGMFGAFGGYEYSKNR